MLLFLTDPSGDVCQFIGRCLFQSGKFFQVITNVDAYPKAFITTLFFDSEIRDANG